MPGCLGPTGRAVHHWVIATPNGRLSEGRCKRCGDVRSDFLNSDLNDTGWEAYRKLRPKRQTARRERPARIHRAVRQRSEATG